MWTLYYIRFPARPRRLTLLANNTPPKYYSFLVLGLSVGIKSRSCLKARVRPRNSQRALKYDQWPSSVVLLVLVMTGRYNVDISFETKLTVIPECEMPRKGKVLYAGLWTKPPKVRSSSWYNINANQNTRMTIVCKKEFVNDCFWLFVIIREMINAEL